MKRTKDGLIPKKYQAPVAIVLSVLFAGVLYWRLAPQASAKAPSPIEAPVAAAAADGAAQVSVDDFKKMLDELKRGETKRAARPTDAPVLARNPFVLNTPSIPELTGPGERTPGSTAGEPEPDSGPSRSEVLASLKLTGTCIADNVAVAVINGKYVKAGDTIEGFTVKSVSGGQVSLTDASGTDVVALEKPKF